MTFGDSLKQWRKRRGLTQQELAGAVGINISYVSNLERDFSATSKKGTPQPSAELVEKIARVLNVDPDEARLAAGYAAQPRKAKTAKEALEIMEKLVPGFEGILTAEGITDENAQRILDDFLTVIELHKRRNG